MDIRTVKCLLIASMVVVAAGAFARVPDKLSCRYVTLARSKPNAFKAKVVYPQFTGASEIEKLANRTLKKWAYEAFQPWVKNAEEYQGKTGNPTAPWELDIRPTVGVAVPHLISLYFTRFEFTGGAHPNTSYHDLHLGYADGKFRQLTLRDFFTDGAQHAKLAGNAAYSVLRNVPADRQPSSITEGNITPESEELIGCFVVTPTAITFLYEPYTLGPYSEGMFVAKVPFREFGNQLNFRGPLRDLLMLRALPGPPR